MCAVCRSEWSPFILFPTGLSGFMQSVKVNGSRLSYFPTGLSGCVQSVKVNGARLPWSGVTQGLGVQNCVVSTCINHQCVLGSTCVPSLANDGTYTCLCGPGMTGTYCQYDMCEILTSTERCMNGGECQIDSAGDTYCRCALPYTGTLCTNSKLGEGMGSAGRVSNSIKWGIFSL